MADWTAPAAAADAAAAQHKSSRDWLPVREAAAIARVSAKRIHAAVRSHLRAACVDGRGRLVLHRICVK
jgi:hypothetical protein